MEVVDSLVGHPEDTHPEIERIPKTTEVLPKQCCLTN
jgi:hypothetical protein